MEPTSNSLSEVTALMKEWEEQQSQPTFNPIPVLSKLADKIELETENYLKMDPDPFDERHPSRTDPDCKLGQILKVIFRRSNFMARLVDDYLAESYFSRHGMSDCDINELNIVACRIMLGIMPGLEITVVFQPDTDSLVSRLIKWATSSVEPLQSYATGILGVAMEIPEIATKNREANARLVPLMLSRLWALCAESSSSEIHADSVRSFSHFSPLRSPPYDNFLRDHHNIRENDIEDSDGERQRKRMKFDEAIVTKMPALINESSNSSWAEMESYMIGTLQLYPPTLATKQIMILRYLTPMGEYQEYLGHMFEHNALELIFHFVNVKETKEARLAFEALKYLAALLCHKKFSIDFIQGVSLRSLLAVPRPSIAATGVSICLYYLAYCEEAMERVCLLPKYVVTNLVKYALWLLECSHDSGRCHATMFFGLTFQFRIILEEFDEQDGLRKLHNLVATLPILSDEENTLPTNEDAECASRQIVRHVCVAYKRYLEAHLYIKVEQLRRSQFGPNDRPHVPALPFLPSYKPCKSSSEEVQQEIETLLQIMPFRAYWLPVEQLMKLGGITLLLKIIAFAYDWNYGGRAETVRCALDVLAIACVIPKVVSLFCEQIELPDEAATTGMHIILRAVNGEIVADAEVQKAALRVIVNCVCPPIHRMSVSAVRFSGNNSFSALSLTNSPARKTKMRSSEELIEKVWDCVRSNNGIMVLTQLLNTKVPITDADCIRGLACKALAGLARSQTVRQIVSKLPLIVNGQLQILSRDPILQEKRQEHVSFQKYVLELLERISGKTKRIGTDLDISLGNIHKANIVAQTRIHFNDRQLLQLIYEHCVLKGLTETAQILQREAHLSSTNIVNSIHPSKFRYTPLISTPTHRSRLPLTSSGVRTTPIGNSSVLDDSTSSNNGIIATPTSIKIKKKICSSGSLSNSSQKPRLQKQLDSEPVLIKSTDNSFVSKETPRVTLDSIITEYLTNQHALCKNPMATCPQFNLFIPHKCPDPKPRSLSCNNFVVRSARRQMGYQSTKLDRKLIHSRFCPVQSIRMPDNNGFYTCITFLPGDQKILVGSYSGEIHIYDANSGAEENRFKAHSNYVANVESNREGTALLSSSNWGRPLSALWSLETHLLLHAFKEDDLIEFSKSTQDRLVGTKGSTATIYDINTGSTIVNLVPTVSNQYLRNQATFSYNDNLVLSDGVLFDVTSGKQIHKLDKLNQIQSGVFHPNGLEILSNTEVWDLRTFHLLKTVPVLNRCVVDFATTNSVIYGVSFKQDNEDNATYDSSFKTVDASDYSSIATIDIKRYLYDLTVNRYDTQIAIVENQGVYLDPQESVIRLYEVGRKRDDEDEQEDEDGEDDLDGSDDDDDDDDSDDNDNDAQDDALTNEENEDDNNDDNEDDDDDDMSASWTTDSDSSSNLSSFIDWES